MQKREQLPEVTFLVVPHSQVTNITGTLVMLELAVAAGVECFLYTSTTSTTSTFGAALTPAAAFPARPGSDAGRS